jgi:hypothetical protein
LSLAGVVRVGVFHFHVVAFVPNRYTPLLLRRVAFLLPSGSSNAKTRDEEDEGVYEDGVLTHEGF